MKRTGIVYHPDFHLHSIPFHPESEKRLEAIMEWLEEVSLKKKVSFLTPPSADSEIPLKIHSKEHVYHIERLSREGGGIIDSDTSVTPHTFRVACLAAGGCVMGVEKVFVGEVENCFALVRPPGHHATRDRAMGFCYFNNIAVAAAFLKERFGLNRIFIFDFDVHAGNGTMEIFYDDPEVLFVSIHQDPRFFYPGTGFTAQSGKGRGEGYTVNIPMKPGAGDDDYIFLFEEFIAPLVERFEPQFICVSCGLDAHKDDPISQIELTEYGFRSLSNLLCQSARKLCNGRLFLCLEGGYNLEGLKRSVGGIIESLLDEKQEDTHYNQNKVKSSTMSLLETLQGLNFL